MAVDSILKCLSAKGFGFGVLGFGLRVWGVWPRILGIRYGTGRGVGFKASGLTFRVLRRRDGCKVTPNAKPYTHFFASGFRVGRDDQKP